MRVSAVAQDVPTTMKNHLLCLWMTKDGLHSMWLIMMLMTEVHAKNLGKAELIQKNLQKVLKVE